LDTCTDVPDGAANDVRNTFVIIARPEDKHALAVAEVLGRNDVSVQILDLRRLNRDWAIHYSYPACTFVITALDAIVATEKTLLGLWNRQARAQYEVLDMDDTVPGAISALEHRDRLSWFYAFLDSLSQHCAVYHPPSVEMHTHSRLNQLNSAREYGFRVPRTFITNQSGGFDLLLRDRPFDHLVAKRFNSTGRVERFPAVEFGGGSSLDGSVPYILQEHIAGRDLRITLIGSQLVGLETTKGLGQAIDSRANIGRIMREVEIPNEVGLATMKICQSLSLRLAALDFVVDDNDDWYFLEINLMPQFLFIERATGLPVTEMIARMFLRGAG
jgi:hypothetical protein